MSTQEKQKHLFIHIKGFFLICIILLFIINIGAGQVFITFQIDLNDLSKKELFSENSGDKIYVRGSFNNWSGTEYILKKSAGSNLYSGKFKFKNPEDTLSYKFVIDKKNGHSLWENDPNPSNPDNANRKLIIQGENIILPPAYFHYDEYISYPVIFSEKKLREDFLQFREILETTHPALYDYTQKEVLDSIFDANYSQINSDMDFNSFLILMTEVISKVGCGHTSLWIPDKYWYTAPEKLFPAEIVISRNKIFIKGTYGDYPDIPIGSELLSINKNSIKEIIHRLTSLTSADGFNLSYRKAKVVQNFSVKYALAFGFPEYFKIEYLPPNDKKIVSKIMKPVSIEAVNKRKMNQTELSFKQIDSINAGLLTINTFGYYGQVEMFRNFTDSVFREIEKKEMNNLILDLRGNSGGDPFCASYLWAYLQPRPLPYFEDHYGRYDTLANPIPQPMHNFKGNLFTLIDGNGFSTTGHFCGLLKFHKVGKFIGTELGSTYTCTGNATYPPLKNTGIMVGTARVMRYTAAVVNMDPRRGIIPDYQIQLDQNDIINGADKVMEFTLSLVKSKQ